MRLASVREKGRGSMACSRVSIVVLCTTLAGACAAAGPNEPDDEAVGVTESALSATTTYAIAAIQPLPGDSNTSAFAINNAGTVTGVSLSTTQSRGDAIRVSSSGAAQDLGTLPGGPYSAGPALNDYNQVA